MQSASRVFAWRDPARHSVLHWRALCSTALIAALLLPYTCGATPRPAPMSDGSSTVNHPSPQLAALLRGAEVAFVGRTRGQDAADLVLMRKPTRPLPLHRCGAGTEDFLLLLRPRGGVMQLDDRLRVQSCEHGEHLDIDDPESTEQLIDVLRTSGSELVLPTRYSFSPTPDTVVSRRYMIGKRFQPVR
jgi:hypothetical protein